uniref:Cyclin-dependent kinase inhibitor 1B n=1 Tax=Periophthalmus magnuspinnatus TaxID=409849 RepID=A0A3B4BLW2_9GOBI
MSDVRLSNASPTLERVDARQPDSVRPSVRRCLFGSPDREELRETFQEFMQEEARRFRDTYNFDPVEDRPLSPGRFQWEVDEDAPEFYRRPPHGRLRDNNSGNNNHSSAAPRSKSSRSNGEHEGAQPERGTSRAVRVTGEGDR